MAQKNIYKRAEVEKMLKDLKEFQEKADLHPEEIELPEHIAGNISEALGIKHEEEE